MLTIDILFENEQYYELAKRSGKLNKSLFSQIYRIEEEKIEIYECDNCYALKISFPRATVSGGVLDSDLFGGQQHAPLVYLEI
jgi:hypothetical protein